MDALQSDNNSRFSPVGYGHLLLKYAIQAMPHYCRSYIGGSRVTREENEQSVEIYPKRYAVAPSDFAQLEFAIKYEGINLEIIAYVFDSISVHELSTEIANKSTSKYARKIWFLYEYLTGHNLPLRDLMPGVRPIQLLDEESYYVFQRDERVFYSARHHVFNNLVGNKYYCPFIRRTPKIEKYIQDKLDDRCRANLAAYPDEILRRAVDYMFLEETKSSYAIERITPSPQRSTRFVELLKQADAHLYIDRELLVSLQNVIVEERYANKTFRVSQVYVGKTLKRGNEDIRYIAPKPQDINALMEGWMGAALAMQLRLSGSVKHSIHPVVFAGAFSFGFVLLHPFDDGNGRIHRFLIHNILATEGFTPSKSIFPVSATMLRQRQKYEALLEAYSKPLMQLIDFEMDDDGRMTVQSKTMRHYQYPDMTRFVEGLFEFIRETIETDLPMELDFLLRHDEASRELRGIVDMPDRKVDSFILLCRENMGRLSKLKRSKQFSELSGDEIQQMEMIVQKAFDLGKQDH